VENELTDEQFHVWLELREQEIKEADK